MEAASTEPAALSVAHAGRVAADAHAAAEHDSFAERPELFVGAAFAGGLVLAGVLRWLGRDE